MRLAVLTVLLAALALTTACGPEDIQLARADASTIEAGGDAGDMGTLTGGDGAAPACEAGAPPPACRALDEPCGGDSDCCSTHCAAGACVATGTCGGAGASCASPGDCCSGRCEPGNGTTARTCLAECRPDGVACARASDCCALDCNAGVCGGVECLEEGTACAANADCCSNLCDATQDHKCVIDPVAVCRPSGESCNSGGKGSCCGACDDTLQRCDEGTSACRALGVACAQALDCCSGACTKNAGGVPICAGPLLTDGARCQASFECASGSCGNAPPSCGEPPLATCVPTGDACGEGGACCSGICAGGLCQPGCVPVTR
jgi:hypothetical protein